MTHLQTLFQHDKDHETIAYLESQQFLTLDITHGCNLGCPYCVSAKHPNTQAQPTIIEEMGLKAYLAQLDRMVAHTKKLQVRLVGEGEVTTSPHFMKIVEWAFQHNFDVQIQSNLHGISRIEKLVAQYPNKKANWKIGLSYHAGAYELLGKPQWRTFWVQRWFPRLVALGVQILKIDTPLHPILYQDPNLLAEFQSFQQLTSVNIQPVSLVGQGYPEKYTPEEQQWVAELQGHFLSESKQYNTQWTPEQIPYLVHHMELQGFECWMAARNFKIKANGNITSCGGRPPQIQWNIKTYPDQPLFASGPIKCPYPICSCRSHGIYNCLAPHNVTMRQYYHAWYLDQNQPEIAQLFEEKNNGI